jgi:hypothetical protein
VVAFQANCNNLCNITYETVKNLKLFAKKTTGSKHDQISIPHNGNVCLKLKKLFSKKVKE